MDEISRELRKLTPELTQTADEARQKIALEKVNKLTEEMSEIMQRQNARSILQTAETLARTSRNADDDDDDDDEEEEDDDDSGPRFLAEWRDQPLSFLQVSLLTRVIAADLRAPLERAGYRVFHLLPGKLRPLGDEPEDFGGRLYVALAPELARAIAT